MSFNIDQWMEKYRKAVTEHFGSRIWFMGLQGSYGRGEASPESDIDVVLILDQAGTQDFLEYRDILDALPERDRICGFVSGKDEIEAWEPSDLFQFYYDTTPMIGSLDPLLDHIRREDIVRAIRTGACNVYHMCVHNLVHEQNGDILKGLYKSAVFTLQAIAFLKTGVYEKKKKDLAGCLPLEDNNILSAALEIKKANGLSPKELTRFSGLLLEWASAVIRKDWEENGHT